MRSERDKAIEAALIAVLTAWDAGRPTVPLTPHLNAGRAALALPDAPAPAPLTVEKVMAALDDPGVQLRAMSDTMERLRAQHTIVPAGPLALVPANIESFVYPAVMPATTASAPSSAPTGSVSFPVDEHGALWDAIAEFAQHPPESTSVAKQKAVVGVERAVDAIIAAVDRAHPPTDAAAAERAEIVAMLSKELDRLREAREMASGVHAPFGEKYAYAHATLRVLAARIAAREAE